MKKKESNEKIKNRRKMILRCLIMGMDVEEIIKYLKIRKIKISAPTVYRDIIVVRESNKTLAEQMEPKEIMGFIEKKQEERTREYWMIVKDREVYPNIRIQALNALREEDKEMIKRLQILGILPKNNPQVTVST